MWEKYLCQQWGVQMLWLSDKSDKYAPLPPPRLPHTLPLIHPLPAWGHHP